MALQDFSVRLMTEGDFHLIVPVRAGTPDMADKYARSFVLDVYKERTMASIVRLKGRSLPVWCKKALRTKEVVGNGQGNGRRT